MSIEIKTFIVLAGNRDQYDEFIRTNAHSRRIYIYADSVERITVIPTPHVLLLGTYTENPAFKDMLTLINSRRARFGLPSI